MYKYNNIVQAGVAKSGNYWLWKIIHTILINNSKTVSSNIENSEHLKKFYDQIVSHNDQTKIDVIDVNYFGIYWRFGQYYREKIKNIDLYLDRAKHIWTHSKYSENFNLIFKGEKKSDIKCLIIIRNPIDIVKSQANFMFTPYIKATEEVAEKSPQEFFDNNFELSLYSWKRNVSSWLANQPKNTLVIFYENFVNNFDNELREIINFMDIKVDKIYYFS